MTILANELMNHEYRKIEMPLEDIFPKLHKVSREDIKENFSKLKTNNPHETIFNVATELWDHYYSSILECDGFYDKKYSQFSGRCHQCTPVLGLVLNCLGFNVSYLECFRIKEHFSKTGKIEKVSPEEEPNPEMKAEFCSINRIPYCCLEVNIEGKNYYMTGKHLRPNKSGEKIEALLTPECYIPFEGTFHHQLNNSKSGIYLQTVIPDKNPDSINFSERIVWKKQTFNDKNPELFATFLRMHLI
ncbi:MAG TPA: hypothetical protein VJB94_04540 [Candidatus Nanoarchaeia archaeon]|nr:hypothetical protein [Candidatus Nanoarchaeia archaeon]